MKTSLGDDCVAINLDYDAVKEVVQIVYCPNDYESARLRTRERHENFTLRFGGYAATEMHIGRQTHDGPSEACQVQCFGSMTMSRRPFLLAEAER
jgi:hypothetical protein